MSRQKDPPRRMNRSVFLLLTIEAGYALRAPFNTALSWSNCGGESGLKGLQVIEKDRLNHNMMEKPCDYDT